MTSKKILEGPALRFIVGIFWVVGLLQVNISAWGQNNPLGELRPGLTVEAFRRIYPMAPALNTGQWKIQHALEGRSAAFTFTFLNGKLQFFQMEMKEADPSFEGHQTLESVFILMQAELDTRLGAATRSATAELPAKETEFPPNRYSLQKVVWDLREKGTSVLELFHIPADENGGWLIQWTFGLGLHLPE